MKQAKGTVKRKGLQRRAPLRADPAKIRAWQERSRQKPRTKPRKPLRARNPKRLKRLRAQQFGDDGKREWILEMPYLVTGRRPVDPAHVLGTRGAGYGPEGMAPLYGVAHTDFDSSMSEGRFEEKYGHTRAWIRARARLLDQEWKGKGRTLSGCGRTANG